MEVFTSYFGNHKKFPKNAVLISIAGKSPEGFYPEHELKMLAPSWSISSEYRETGDKDLYTKRYKKEILSKLDPNVIYGIISNIAYTLVRPAYSFCVMRNPMHSVIGISSRTGWSQLFMLRSTPAIDIDDR